MVTDNVVRTRSIHNYLDSSVYLKSMKEKLYTLSRIDIDRKVLQRRIRSVNFVLTSMFLLLFIGLFVALLFKLLVVSLVYFALLTIAAGLLLVHSRSREKHSSIFAYHARWKELTRGRKSLIDEIHYERMVPRHTGMVDGNIYRNMGLEWNERCSEFDLVFSTFQVNTNPHVVDVCRIPIRSLSDCEVSSDETVLTGRRTDGTSVRIDIYKTHPDQDGSAQEVLQLVDIVQEYVE